MVIPRCGLLHRRLLLLPSSAAALLLSLAAYPAPQTSTSTHYHRHHPLGRIITTTMATTASSSGSTPLPAATAPYLKKEPARVAAATQLLKDTYGDWDTLLPHSPHLFPKPMPATEAGPSMVPYGGDAGEGEGEATQRRYLWTDAFGVLGFAALALRCEPGEENRRARLLQAGAALIDAVHATLGQPRTPNFPMLRAEDAARALGGGSGGGQALPVPVTPHGYVGLRIGKERARLVSDAGMSYDGMYAHYLDKWMFALLRFGQTCGLLGDAAAAETYLTQAEQLIQAVHPFFVQHDRRSGQPLGVYWKLNVDMSPILGLERTGPSEDALCWWVVYSLVRHARTAKTGGASPIEHQWQEIDRMAGAYVRGGLRVSSDPLGYGLLGWKSQWMGSWAEGLHARLQVLAPMGVMDVESGMQLPFRLYGALLGARLLTDGAPPGGRGTDARSLAERALAAVTDVELADQDSLHSSINKAMLAAALDPLAFARWEGEPLLPVPGSGSGGGET